MIQRCKKGFSLIELIVVIAVMAVIAAVIVPSIGGTKEAAEEQAAKAAAGTLNLAQAQWRLGNDVSTWDSKTDAARYTAIAAYMEYSDADWATFQARYPKYTLQFQKLDPTTGKMRKVTLTRKSDSQTVNY